LLYQLSYGTLYFGDAKVNIFLNSQRKFTANRKKLNTFLKFSKNRFEQINPTTLYFAEI
jgi:cytidylate kinase